MIKTKQICAVLGAQWGDEGKGRYVSALECDICVRYNGGANAGHTVVIGDKKYDFHLIPCAIVNESGKFFIRHKCERSVAELKKKINMQKM
jgi:adenylosuccinate synthase